MNFSRLIPQLMGLIRTSAAVCMLSAAGTSLAGDVDALYQAAQGGDTARVTTLLDSGVDVNGRSSNGSYALNAAAAENDVALIQVLLVRGANPDVQNRQGDTPLICATKYGGGDGATVKLLVEAGTDQNIRDSQGMTALDYAKKRDQKDAIALLGGADS